MSRSDKRLAAQVLAAHGCIDTPDLRHTLDAERDRVMIWRRDCEHSGHCHCWDFAGTRPATAEDHELFRVAAMPITAPPRGMAQEDLAAELRRKWGGVSFRRRPIDTPDPEA